MSLRDAAIVSALAATATYCLTFFANLTLDQLMADPLLVVFDSLKTWLATFWGTLITLAGLEKYVHRKEKSKSKDG
jgi:hypothetical protein